MTRLYLSTTIPYVNARPHVGHALELVQADVLARHHRRIGDEVRLQSGTDDNSLKNVLAARREGISTTELVNRNAGAFASLREQLSLSFDDFIRTSSDPRHRPGVDRLWRACKATGDLYLRDYQGLYCVGCEQFYTEDELAGGVCPEHLTRPERVAEQNWFFRLSRYASRLRAEISSGRLRIEPVSRRNEVLSFIDGGLADISVSRSVRRAGGWGIAVPDDPSQVIYVWWDALGNYVTALGYGRGRDEFRRWWAEADRRIHLVGKGVLRFHAVYWPAILLSAGIALPTEIFVHDYLTAGGSKISKSAESLETTDPAVLADTYGADALRWWLLRDVPRVGDTDFTVGRLIGRANADLANGLGNLVSRVGSIAHKYRNGAVRACSRPDGTSRWLAAASDGRLPGRDDVAVPWPDDAAELLAAVERAPDAVRAALARFDFRAASAAVFEIVVQANRYIDATEPWRIARAELARAELARAELARAELARVELAGTGSDGDGAAGQRLEQVLGALLAACQVLAAELWPFLPDLAARVATAVHDFGGRLPAPQAVFPRIEVGQPGYAAGGPGGRPPESAAAAVAAEAGPRSEVA